MLNFIIWNGSPEIMSIGSFALRWYGLLFALGFLICQQVLYYMYRQEGKPDRDVDTLTVYMMIATIIGARLGHVIFYEPTMLWKEPLSVILPFELHPFKFTGLQGLASHGAAIGILFGLWLYSRKKKPNQNYLQVLDRIVILVCLTGCFIRLGNFFNSEIIGKPSNNPLAVVFINRVTESIQQDQSGKDIVEKVTVEKTNLPNGQDGRVPINILLLFKTGVSEQQARSFVTSNVKYYLSQYTEFVDEPSGHTPPYDVIKGSDGNYSAFVQTFGIARHPAQLYESLSCLALFGFLFWYWSRKKINLPEGRIFGLFMIILWTLRFAYEFLKINQVSFEDTMTLNMGQILSIPLVIVGVLILIRSYQKPQQQILDN
ncbi:MAG: prolipoprotein diacylglyceryl transferase [Bacteroidetes bacterium]|nr:prolipoprotein diacylglyceryl transferase [Bacteroidota bacterium]MBS1539275.1 prolipoprotein diacylglyceryl transferase [Bacteroidota bacterium]